MFSMSPSDTHQSCRTVSPLHPLARARGNRGSRRHAHLTSLWNPTWPLWSEVGVNMLQSSMCHEILNVCFLERGLNGNRSNYQFVSLVGFLVIFVFLFSNFL